MVKFFTLFEERAVLMKLCKQAPPRWAFFIFRAIFCFALVLATALLRAEEGAQDLGEIQVTAPSEHSSEIKPSGFVSVIDPKPFINKVKTIQEVLSQQPGVDVQEYGSLGQYTSIGIRGSSAEQVLVLLDGVRLNTVGGGAVDFSSIPLDSLDRIEIIRGGATAQYGSDAMGGVINIITKRARKKQSFELSGGGGSFQTAKQNLGYSRRFENWSFLLDQTFAKSAGDFSFITTPTIIGAASIGGGQEFTRTNNSFWSNNSLFKIEGSPKKDLNLSLTTDWFVSRRQIAATEQEVILFPPSQLPLGRERLLKNVTALKAELKSLGLEGLNLQIQPYYRYNFSHFSDPQPALGGAIDVKNFDHSVGGLMAWDYSLPQGFVLHHFKFNYEIKRDWFDSHSPLGNPTTGFHQRITNGVYGGDEISFWEDKFFLSPEARFENTTDFGSKYALHLGLKGKPLDWLTLKSNIENSFRYPNFIELYLPNEGIIRGNPDLRPESAINFDAGFEIKYPYGWFSATYFLNEINNSIIFVPISAFTIAPVNTDQVRAQGTELAFTFTPWEHLDISGNYTYLHATLKSTGQQLPGRPKQKANVTLTLKNKWGSLYGTLQFIDDLPINFAGTTFLRKRAQVNVGGSIDFLEYWHFAIEVKDINNIQMLDTVGFPLPRLSAFASLGLRI